MPISTTYNPNAPVGKTGVGSAVGNREDLSSELTILAPEETPILSICAKGKATSTFYEWTADTLAAPTTEGISEGSDVTAFSDKFKERARLGNYTQIFRRDFLVSNLQNATLSSGPANIAAAEGKALREIKRDVEAALASDNDRSVENGAGTPYKLRGLGKWIESAANTGGAGASSDIPDAYKTPSDSIKTGGATLTESAMNDIVSSIFTVNGESNSLTLIAGTSLRKAIANFARTATTGVDRAIYNVNEDAGMKKITHAVQVYDSDFGIVNIINGNPSCMPAKTRGYLLNQKYIGVNTLIPLGVTRLENQGGGERGFVDMACTLCVKHPGAHGKIVA